MSQSSFPRDEHIALLKERITSLLQRSGLGWELHYRALDRYHCSYRFELVDRARGATVPLTIHFQVAVRLAAAGSEAELIRLVDAVLRAAGEMV